MQYEQITQLQTAQINRLVSKKSKLKLYWSIIRPTVTYACEAWVLKETIKNKSMVCERKV